MSDLATALKIALAKKTEQEKQMQTRTHNTEDITAIANAWADDDKRDGRTSHKAIFKPTNNVSRETFNAVRDNPRLQYKDLVRMMANRGFNMSSIGSLLTQMTKCGLITRDDMGRYTALQTEYTPIKSKPKAKTKAKKIAVPGMKKKAEKAGIAALDTQDGMEKKLVVIRKQEAQPPAFDPDQLLSTLSFAQVMALYKRIKTMVGEA